jgi:hypothetical protein
MLNHRLISLTPGLHERAGAPFIVSTAQSRRAPDPRHLTRATRAPHRLTSPQSTLNMLVDYCPV